MCQNSSPNPNPCSPDSGEPSPDEKKQALVRELALKLSHGDAVARVQAARDIRRHARSSPKARSLFASAAVVQPLVSMLPSPDHETREASLLALLNLAVRNERNKDKIVKTGAVPHLVELLRSENCGLRELATAAILTLSASDANKTIIAASGVVPLLVQILISGGIQGKVDAVTALYNLSICKENTFLEISVEAITPLLALLKDSKKYSKFAEKATSLLGILAESEEGRCVIAESDGAILTLVETVEEGSPFSTEYAVGILLSLCKGCREKYRELILKEGAIPGLLLLTADGTTKARVSAHELLDLLRDESKPKRVPSEDLETIVYDIATRVDGPERAEETAKKLLHDMVRRNMELSINKLQHRAALHTPNVPLT
ncbi:U-box domain-containing protein 14 [Dioscorea cayenensis subsp. rotundata]|uniref:U-box domain-containing protein 14 n=1 Tax=Dioscorea cayennensis subsp. rotundata TaxID=55577 RepID=A0AB40BI37_DIOCR|nr:U-box domain-containing protein 14 [Dioscorea cayenensis subsp. rotundata]